MCDPKRDHQVLCKVNQRNNKVGRSRIFYIIYQWCSVFVLLPKNYLPLLHTITQTCSNTANPPCFDIAIQTKLFKSKAKVEMRFSDLLLPGSCQTPSQVLLHQVFPPPRRLSELKHLCLCLGIVSYGVSFSMITQHCSMYFCSNDQL